MSTSQHTHQIAHDVLGQYISVGLEDPEAPHQFPLQPPNPPTAPTPIKANTFVHILDSPTLPQPISISSTGGKHLDTGRTPNLSHLATGCVTSHSCHCCVMAFRPIFGN